jgi:hypothetical protein
VENLTGVALSADARSKQLVILLNERLQSIKCFSLCDVSYCG